MKKTVIGLGLALLVTSMFVTSCTMSDGMVDLIAQNAGTGLALTWVATQNPDDNALGLVCSTLEMIQTNISAVAVGTTYSEALYPLVSKYVQSSAVPDLYKPVVLIGVQMALNGIDTLFIVHPEWKVKQDLAVRVVDSFVNGVLIGLNTSNPKTVEARNLGNVNARVWVK